MNGTGLWTWLAGVGLVSALAATAAGQGGGRGMVAIDDGNERHALSYAEPDVKAITSPYITRSDIPVFVEYLWLSSAQQAAVERLIEQYLEEFQTLVMDMHPQPERAKMANARRRPGDEGGDGAARARAADGEPAEDEDDQPREEDRLSPVLDILEEELKAEGVIKESLDELPVEPGIGIGISVDGPAEDGQPPQPTVDVSISFGGEDDRLDEALRGKLEAAVQRAVPRIAEMVREREMAMLMQRMGQEGLPPAEEIAKRFDELEALRKRVSAFKAEADALLQRLFANIKRLLSEQQLEQWPAFERALRRIKTLPWGQLDGESTDLLEVVDELELDDEQMAQLDEALLSYEMQLDAALTRRNGLLETADAVIDRALYIGEYDQATAMAHRAAAARLAVRDLNDRTIDTLAGALGGKPGERLRRESLADAYPRIYRRTIGEQAFDQVIVDDDLDEQARLNVLELAQQYLLRINEVNERLYRSVRREQEDELVRSVERSVATLQNREGGMTEPGEPSQIAEAFQERRDLDAQYMRMLYAMLPEEMVAALPKLPKHRVGEEVAAEHRERPEDVEPY